MTNRATTMRQHIVVPRESFVFLTHEIGKLIFHYSKSEPPPLRSYFVQPKFGSHSPVFVFFRRG